MDLSELNSFIVAAKRAAYVGGGASVAPSREGAHDLVWEEGQWRYRDSYFGGTDFLGQEVVWLGETPVWAMNYYDYILRNDLIDARRAGETIKAALSALYEEGRFLGGWRCEGSHGVYEDSSEGDAAHFSGREVIVRDGVEVYALDYCGGLIKP